MTTELIKRIKFIWRETPKKAQGFFMGAFFMGVISLIADILIYINNYLHWTLSIILSIFFVYYIVIYFIKIMTWCEIFSYRRRDKEV